MFCKNCGKQIADGSQFCTFCGAPQHGEAVSHGMAPGAAYQQGATYQPAAAYQPGAAPRANGYLVASSGKRFGNYLLDTIFTVILDFIIGFILGFAGVFNGSNSGVSTLIALAVMLGYYLLMEAIWGQTLGKMITGTKVVLKSGAKLDFPHALGRTFARLIPFNSFSFLAMKRGWHDMVSGTVVVPKEYTPEQVQQIDYADAQKLSWWLLVGLGIFLVMIVGIVVTIILLSLNFARGKERDAKRVADVRQTQTALELYFNDHKSYPVQESPGLISEALMPLTKPGPQGLSYWDNIPSAPTPADTGICAAPNGSFIWNDYVYQSNDGKSYALTFCLGGNVGSISAGKHTITPTGIQ